jgi:hypothetical protein
MNGKAHRRTRSTGTSRGEYVVMDEAIPSEPEEAGLSCIPAAFDSHLHSDRTSKAIWGRDTGHTIEDLLAISTHGPVASQPTFPVRPREDPGENRSSTSPRVS